MCTEVTLEMVYNEVKRVNERLDLIEDIIEVKVGKREEELEVESRRLGMDPGEYSLALIYRNDDIIILANGRAERKIRENFGCLVKDILEVGREASSAGIVDLKGFAQAIYRAGYRTRRVRLILGG